MNNAKKDFLEISEGVGVDIYFIRWGNGEFDYGYCTSNADKPSPHDYYKAKKVYRKSLPARWYTTEDVEELKRCGGDVGSFLAEMPDQYNNLKSLSPKKIQKIIN